MSGDVLGIQSAAFANKKLHDEPSPTLPARINHGLLLMRGAIGRRAQTMRRIFVDLERVRSQRIQLACSAPQAAC